MPEVEPSQPASRRFFRLKGVSNETSGEIDSKVSRFAMPGMLTLRDGLESVIDEEPLVE